MQAQLDAGGRRAEDGRRLRVRQPFGLDQIERGPLRRAQLRQGVREAGARYARSELLLAGRCVGRERCLRYQPMVVELDVRLALARRPASIISLRAMANAQGITAAPMTKFPRA